MRRGFDHDVQGPHQSGLTITLSSIAQGTLSNKRYDPSDEPGRIRRTAMRYVWLALAFVAVLVVGLLAGIVLGRGGGGEQGGAAPSLRTVTVEKTVPSRTSGETPARS